MLKILIAVFLLLVIYRVIRVRSFKNARGRFTVGLEETAALPETFVDPVCGKEVARKDAFLLDKDDTAHGFCSKECLRTWCRQQHVDWKL